MTTTSVAAQRRKTQLAPPADFGSRLFMNLKDDMTSEEAGCRRRRAYTEMDDLLADDIKQGEHETITRQRSNQFSGGRDSSGRTKRQ